LDDNLKQIDDLIAALRKEKSLYKRRFELLGKQKTIIEDWCGMYLELWSLKQQRGINAIDIPNREKHIFEFILSDETLREEEQYLEAALNQFIRDRRSISFAEIENIIETFDTLIDKLETYRMQIISQKPPPQQDTKKLVGKIIKIIGGLALISLDIPVLNVQTIIGGAILVISTPLEW